jgi:hypothetical protein
MANAVMGRLHYKENHTEESVLLLMELDLLDLYKFIYHLAQEDFSNGRFNERIEERDEELDQPRINPTEAINAG